MNEKFIYELKMLKYRIHAIYKANLIIIKYGNNRLKEMAENEKLESLFGKEFFKEYQLTKN